jgi:hypothetical protein
MARAELRCSSRCIEGDPYGHHEAPRKGGRLDYSVRTLGIHGHSLQGIHPTGGHRSFHLVKNDLRLARTSSALFACIMSLNSALISSCRCLGAWASLWTLRLSSDAGPDAPPSLPHLARALASGLLALAFRLFGVFAIIDAIWDVSSCRHPGTGRHVTSASAT